jgi:hypothetical protein
MVLLVSFVTSPYGAWHFDLVLLLVPLLATAASLASNPGQTRTRWLIGFYVVANGIMLVQNLLGLYSYTFAWVAPVTLLMYDWLERRKLS